MENDLQVKPRRDVGTTRRDAAREPQAGRPARVLEVRPAIDIFENGEGLRILADVPGVDIAGAELEVEMPQLRIACTRAATHGASVRYTATIIVPDFVDPGSIVAELRNGVLEISMTKSARARAQRIAVRSAEQEVAR